MERERGRDAQSFATMGGESVTFFFLSFFLLVMKR
jgi:hypothetical protein